MSIYILIRIIFNMIKKYIINKITVTTMCVILLGMFYLIPTNKIEPEQEKTDKIKNIIYLLDEDNMLSQVTYFYTKETIKDQIKHNLELLINGIETNDIFYPLIPKNTKINDISIDKNNIYIDFNKEILNISKNKEEKMIEAIIYTLTEINGIENIYLSVEKESLTTLPNANKQIPYPLTREYGINKKYDLDNLKNINKTTIVFSKEIDDYNYYVPVTLINNNDDEKINIIIEELKSVIHSEKELNGYINNNLVLEDYEFNKDTLNLVFNEYIYDNIEEKTLLEEVKYIISESIFENYDVKKVVLDTKNEKNIAKIEENSWKSKKNIVYFEMSVEMTP